MTIANVYLKFKKKKNELYFKLYLKLKKNVCKYIHTIMKLSLFHLDFLKNSVVFHQKKKIFTISFYVLNTLCINISSSCIYLFIYFFFFFFFFFFFQRSINAFKTVQINWIHFCSWKYFISNFWNKNFDLWRK